jgi:hypothetical protein
MFEYSILDFTQSNVIHVRKLYLFFLLTNIGICIQAFILFLNSKKYEPCERLLLQLLF